MADTIAVSLQATDSKFTSDVLKASDAMGKLAKQEEKLAKNDKQWDNKLKELNKFAKEQDKLFAKTKKIESDNVKKSQALANKAMNQRRGEERKSLENTKKLLSGNIAEAAGLGAAGVAAAALAVAFIAAAVAAGVLLGVVANAAIEVGKLREGSLAAMNVLTGGRGAEALALVDKLAESTGMKIQTARDRFVQFRQAGADNKVSAMLLKLSADLDSIDPSGKLAKEAIDKVLAKKNTDGTLDVKAAKEEMSLLAKQAGVAGDGTAALAARFTTLGGALNSIDNTKTKILEQIWTNIEPAISKAAGAFAKWFDSFSKSAKGQKIIEGISSAISFMAEIFEASIPFIQAAIEGLLEGLDFFKPLLDTISDAFSSAFGEDKKGTIDAVKTVFTLLTVAIGGAVTAFATVIGIAAAVQGAIYALLFSIDDIVAAFLNLGSALYDAGKAAIEGFINGVTSMASKLMSKVTGLASGVKDAFVSVLQIGSPSRVFEKLGQFTSEGFGKGLENNAPDAEGVARSLIPNTGGGSSGASSGGGPLLVIEQVNIQGQASVDETMRSLRREIQSIVTNLLVQRGRA